MFPDLEPRHRPPRLLVVVAHPDDETFGCGSLLLAAAAAGWRTTVASATRGEAGEASPATDLTRPLGDVREDELQAAARLLQVSEVRLLGFADSGMAGDPAPGSLAAAGVDEIRVAVRSLVDDTDPDVVVTLDGSDGHRDHVAVRDATVDVAQEQDRPVFLHCLARSLMDRWVDHMSERQPDLVYLRTAGLGTPDDQITLVLDTDDQYDARLRAIAAHASQTSPYAGLPAELQRAFLTREHLKRVS